MAMSFIGQIIMQAANFAPRGWAFCNGQKLPINQNTALFSIVGTMYGGDGRKNFALPDLRGRSPLHPGKSLGSRFGVNSVTLTIENLPTHSHDFAQPCSTELGESDNPQGQAWAALSTDSSPPPESKFYDAASALKFMDGYTPAPIGGSQPIALTQPIQVVNFIICVQGIMPTR